MPNRPLEIIILSPTGQDAQLILNFLATENIDAAVIRDIDEFCHRSHAGCGALILADEALTPGSIDQLNQELSKQEPWSDLPIVLLVSGGQRRRPFMRGFELFAGTGSVSILERPLQPLSLLSAIKVALRSRRRQFLVRDLMRSQVEATRTRDEFISIASHELKTPLTSLKLHTQMSKRIFEKKGPQYMEKVAAQFDYTVGQIDRLNKLVDDMLDITRISTGRLQLVKSTFDFSVFLQELIERFTPLFGAAGIAVNSSITSDVKGEWDSYRIEQVLTNLFSNTVRYAPGAPLNVSLTLMQERLKMTVTDSGCGIEEKNLERIFDRFERESNNPGGLGLGLYITRQIIEQHQGTIRAVSQLGKGTSFIVELPLS